MKPICRRSPRCRAKLGRLTSAGIILLAGLLVVVENAGGATTNAPSTDAKTGDFLREHRSDIVIIKGKEASGSGFVICQAGRRFLVSNTHVLSLIKAPTFASVDRSRLQFSTAPALVAVGHDIILLELQKGSNGITPMDAFERSVTINDPVVVYGNSGGGDVVTAINGKVVGIGADRIEVDAEFEHGNSGSPIIHLPTGKVIGVASYTTTDDLISGAKKVRRFGYRLDTVKRWETVAWANFFADADKLKFVEDTTEELKLVFAELNGLNQRTNKFRRYAYESPVIRNALDDFFSALNHAETEADANQAADDLLAALKDVSQSYPKQIKPTLTYDYFARKLTDQEEYRTEILKAVFTVLKK